MANGASYISRGKKSLGDIAVDGLLAGMAAGLAMGVGLVLMGLLDGSGPWETLGRFDPANEGSATAGGLLHLAVSGIYGVFFALGYHFLVRRRASVERVAWAIGAGYGLALWLAAQFIFLPTLSSTLVEIPWWSLGLAHLIYGIGLGLLIGRSHVKSIDVLS